MHTQEVTEVKRGLSYTISIAKFPPASQLDIQLHGTHQGDPTEEVGLTRAGANGGASLRWLVPIDVKPDTYYLSAASVLSPDLGVNTPLLKVWWGPWLGDKLWLGDAVTDLSGRLGGGRRVGYLLGRVLFRMFEYLLNNRVSAIPG
jgi:hypothetical protein